MRLGSHVAVAVVYRSAAVALIGPLAWELPYAMGMALKRQKKIFLMIIIKCSRKKPGLTF